MANGRGYVDPEIQHLLASVADHFDLEDIAVRERQIRSWRKMILYWNSFSNIYYDEVAHDWRIPDYMQPDNDDDQAYYDRPVNVYRAYLESIIAALSVTIPGITCYPDDATNNLDLQTAKAGEKISQLVYRHNEVSYLWIHALYVFCTQGLVACYNYTDTNDKYGSYEKKQYKDDTDYKYMCPQCQKEIEDSVLATGAPGPMIDSSLDLEALQQDKFQPDQDDVALDNAYDQDLIVCPHCAAELDPNLQKTPIIVTRLVGVTREAKSRQCLEVYGGLNVKVPNYARNQAECPYLRYSYETHYSKVMQMFPHLTDKGRSAQLTGVVDPYESWGRLSPQYNGEYPINNTTVNMYWFRPYAFNVLDEKQAEKLKKLYPNGVKYIKANETFAWAEAEALDDHWTLTQNPLSDYLHHDPLGVLLTSIQDIINELVSLILQTVEHGITQGFADPAVLNFKKYRETEVRPGDIFPAVTKSGKSMSDFFHEIKTANLSPEVMNFYNMVQELGQLVSGALPSLFGGQMAGSKTASEYSMSRSQALQRQQTHWKMLLIWWKTIFGKVIPQYIATVVEDEKFVDKDSQGSFVNVFIRQAELQGKIGRIEIEGDENIPVTWMQQKDVVMQILQAGNPELMASLFSPENLPYVKKALGLVDFVIPGEGDRNKQFEELQQLLNSSPIVMPGGIDPMTGMATPEQEYPSVEIDPDLDNHEIEGQLLRNWLVDDAGRLAKIENPNGYRNALLHFKMHAEAMAMQQAAQQQVEQEQAALSGGKKPENASGAAKPKNEDSDGNRNTQQ